MSLRHKHVKILSETVPACVAGASLFLAVPSAANQRPTVAQSSASDRDGLALRLTAIHEAVTTMADPPDQLEQGDSKLQFVWECGTAGAGVGATLGAVGLAQLEQRAQTGSTWEHLVA
jgi:hypothetical protein